MAVFAFEVATSQPKVKPFMLNSLGLAYERLGEPFNAMAAYDKALDVRPGYVKAIVNRDRLDGTMTEAQRDEYAAMIAVRDARAEALAAADTGEEPTTSAAMAGGTVPDDDTAVAVIAETEPPSFAQDEELAQEP